MRLAYYQRIAAVLKAEGAADLTELMTEDQAAVFPMSEQGHVLKEVGEEMCDLVSLARRVDCETVQEFVGANLSNLTGEQVGGVY
jgi:hypothetical protein